MSINLLQTLLTVAGSLIGVLVGVFFSARIAKQQLSLAFHQSRLEYLENKISKLQQALAEISGFKMDISDKTGIEQKIMSKFIDMFVAKSTVFLTYSHEFPENLEKNVLETVDKVNKFIFLTNTNQKINEEEAKRVVESLPSLQREMTTAIRSRLRFLQKELDSIVSESSN